MRRTVSFIFIFLLSVSLLAQPLSDREILEQIREYPCRAAAGHCPYIAPEFVDTPAPEGYSAFYVSHLGRHGSRYQNSVEGMEKAIGILDKLHNAGLLTASGDTLRTELQHVLAVHTGMVGMLTTKGSREQTALARNLVRRCPGIFNPDNRSKVVFTSTAFARTIQSMAGFSAGILSAAPQLDFEIRSGFGGMNFKRDSDKGISSDEMTSLINKAVKELVPGEKELACFSTRILTDAQQARKLLDVKDLSDTFFSLFRASCNSVCLDIKTDPLRFFTVEELFALYRMNDVKANYRYGTVAQVREFRAQIGKVWARRVVDEADAAIEGNSHCADFRFAHDGNIGPMMNLLGIGPFQYTASPKTPYHNFQTYSNICMASNFQMIFYRNEGGDILVKALYNEREIDFPGLQTTGKVYYKWTDVRKYMVSRTDEMREVPAWYRKHIKEKASQIERLQQDEAFGFYFITDMHYPMNFGNSPSLIEALEASAGKRPVIYGGDAVTYLNDMDDAVARQISAVEQMRGAAPFYWIRGNHDFVNYTGRKVWITKDRVALQNWDESELLRRYTSKNAVYNPQAPYSSYFYFDDPDERVRYIALESTDDVKDNKIIYGISDSQMKWIAGEAVLKAPAGWHIMFFSHVPPVESKDASIAALANLIDALSRHTAFSVGGSDFDFSSRPDLKPLGIVCGHKHKDFDKPLGDGLYQINVKADCNYDRLEAVGSIREQSFEYFSVSKDYKTIRTVRIGDGSNREYKLK